MTWWKAAGIRAAKTIAQTALATIGTETVLGDINWAVVASASILAGILSLLTSVAGLPEVGKNTEEILERKAELTLTDLVQAVGMLSPEGKRVVKKILEEKDYAG